MEKIKELSKVILPETGILAKLVTPKRFILTPDGSKDEDAYAIVVACNKTKNIGVDDIIIKYTGGINGYKLKEETYVLMFEGNVSVAVHPDNFIDPDKITDKIDI